MYDLGIFFVIFDAFIFFRCAAYTTRGQGYSGLVEGLKDGNCPSGEQGEERKAPEFIRAGQEQDGEDDESGRQLDDAKAHPFLAFFWADVGNADIGGFVPFGVEDDLERRVGKLGVHE